MKRLPLLLSLAGVAVLSATLAYWALQLFKPAQRPLAAPPAHSAPAPGPEAAGGLFGGQAVPAAALSNYQLKGVVASGGRDSAAVLAADGKPAQAYALGAEVAPGVSVRQIAPRFVLLAEGGVLKRIELAPDSKAGAAQPASSAAAAPAPPAPQGVLAPPPMPGQPQMPAPTRIMVAPTNLPPPAPSPD